MRFVDCGAKHQFRNSLFIMAACLFCLWVTAPGFGQPAGPQSPAVTGSEAAKPETDKAKAMGTRPAEQPVLQQLNSAIEQLTARISPAVVQIMVTGYGATGESSRGQTAVITQEHVIGSGVIVDPEGYIMTNEGAPHFRLYKVSLDNPLPKHWKEIVPESPTAVLQAGPAALAEYNAGKAVVAQSGCLACHKIGDNGNSGPGPDLTHIGARLPRQGIARTLVNPTAPMPSFKNLPPQKFEAVVGFLSQLK